MVDNTDSLIKSLRKAFQAVYKITQDWADIAQQMQRHVSTACNLIPRLRLIPESKGTQLGVLAHFGSIRERLCQKHVEQLDLILRSLQGSQ